MENIKNYLNILRLKKSIKIDYMFFLTYLQLIFILYFLISLLIYCYSLKLGYNGISIKLFGGSDDGYVYWSQIQNIINDNQIGEALFFSYFCAFVINIIGINSVFVVRFINFIGFVLTVFYSMRLLKVQFDFINLRNKSILLSKILLVSIFFLYPSLQMQVNLSIYRDIWIYFLYMLLLLYSVKYIFYNKNKLIYFVLLVFFDVILFKLRDYAALSFTASFLLFITMRRIKINRYLIPIGGIFVLFMYYSFYMNFTIFDMSLAKALAYRNYFIKMNPGGSQLGIILYQEYFAMFVINYSYSFISNLIGPLFWQINGISTLFVFIFESIPMTLILFSIIRKRKLLGEIQRYILLNSAVWIGIIGFTNDNIGTGTRLRVIAWLPILIVYVFIYVKSKNIDSYLNFETLKEEQ